MAKAANPLKQILSIRRNEWPLAIALWSYFFLIITIFWILKPIKKDYFIEFYRLNGFEIFGWTLNGSEVEQLAKVVNMAVALFAAVAFSWLSDFVRREKFTIVWVVVMAVGLISFSQLLSERSAGVAWSLYLFGDFFNTVMLAAFFAFANDAMSPDSAKRLYGVIVFGGVVGGVVGSTSLRATIDTVSPSSWMLVALGALGGIVIAALVAARWAEKPEETGLARAKALVATAAVDQAPRGRSNAFSMVFSSHYLLGLVALVGVYELVSTIIDFQFTRTVEYLASQGELDQTTAFYSFYAFTNIVGFVVQLFLTSFVMQRFGVGVALFVLPVAALTGSVSFLIAPMYLTAAAMGASDNAFHYSINQSARETLYTVTSREEKYKAKAVIDMFVQRTAKAVGVGINLIAGHLVAATALRYLALVTIPLLVIWLMIVGFLGRRFAEREKEQRSESSEALRT